MVSRGGGNISMRVNRIHRAHDGKVADFVFSYFIFAFEQMGQMGAGQRINGQRPRFVLKKVTVNRVEIYTGAASSELTRFMKGLRSFSDRSRLRFLEVKFFAFVNIVIM